MTSVSYELCHGLYYIREKWEFHGKTQLDALRDALALANEAIGYVPEYYRVSQDFVDRWRTLELVAELFEEEEHE